tara:strand:+ start:793 stop:1071 length:279 start_codon:yes stop_codon:yes gene_type:complete
MAILSTNDQMYLSLAAEEASKSIQLQRHGCIAVSNGKIRGRGFNSCRTKSTDGFINNTCSCHAEIAALRNLWHNFSQNPNSHFQKNLTEQYV